MNAPVTDAPAVRTTCPYCGVGCGVLASATPDGNTGIAGDPQHPANFGRLCSKGSALGETLSLDGRLLHPMLRTRSGGYERVSWSTALDRVAEGFAQIHTQHGADALALYLSGQLLTEDYYVANKLMKGFLGGRHVDTNSRLCMASSVAGHRRAFGGDVVPGSYADLDSADLIVLVGSNAAWCHPVLFQRMLANKAKRGAKIVVIDPRRTASAEDADLFLPVAPGMDTVLFAHLLQEIFRNHAQDERFIDAHTSGLNEALAAAAQIAPDLETVAQRTGIPVHDLETFTRLWIDTPRTVTAWSQGVNQSAQGTDKVDAIINCHLATGRIGREGLGPFSLTGQPNAMGGREVGGLANMLAAHMGYTETDIDRVRRFWTAPSMATRDGFKAVQMFDAIGAGEIRALWIMATNPAVSLPRADRARSALGKLDLFVVSEVLASNDTLNAGAHVLLPAAAWGEKDGTVTNSERRISRQRGFVPLPGEAQPDWWIVCEVAKRLGFAEAFAFGNAAAIFREHATLSGFENDGARGFDISGLRDLDDGAYDALAPVQWPVRSNDDRNDKRLFGDGAFVTPDRKARFIAPATPRVSATTDVTYPLMLNTGRIRDQWHTMTRTGRSPRLALHLPEPFVAIHPEDATRHNLHDGGFARVESVYGKVLLRVRFDDGQLPGTVFAPIHWSAETSSDGRVGALVSPDTDPFSGQPEMKATPVAVASVAFPQSGFIISRTTEELPDGWWWSRVALDGGMGWLIASEADVQQAADWFESRFVGYEIADFIDMPHGRYRAAAFRDGRLEGALFFDPADGLAGFDAMRDLLVTPSVEEQQRRLVLCGRDASGAGDSGPLVCACFGVATAKIRDAVCSGAATNVMEIGALLKAGTNCGSCVPELRRILAATPVSA
jgi:assimilatory nitrate reductase catalytic subunit